MAEIAEIPLDQPSMTGDAKLTSDYFASWAQSNGVEVPESDDPPLPKIEEAAIPPPDGATHTPGKSADEPAPPAEEPKQGVGSAAAAQRIQNRENQKRKEAELEARIAAIEAEKAAKIAELETLATTHKSTADSYAKDLEHYKNTWKGEQEKHWKEIAAEVPEYQESTNKVQSGWREMFPTTLSNPAENESFVRFRPENLKPEAINSIHSTLKEFEDWEYKPGISDADRGKAQHILISRIATRLGIDPNVMDEMEFHGTSHRILPASHPVYSHLAHKIPNLVDSIIQHRAIEEKAQAQGRTFASEAIRQRQENSRSFFKNAGFGVRGDELKTRLQREPDNSVLQAMRLIGEDEDLWSELESAKEREAVTNGFWKPQITLTEDDPVEYDKSARAHLSSIAARSIHAALAPALIKKATRMEARIAELAAENAKLKEENHRNAVQDEPGAASTAGAVTGDKGKPSEMPSYLSNWLSSHGVGAT